MEWYMESTWTVPYGFHSQNPHFSIFYTLFHMESMESIWKIPGTVKYCIYFLLNSLPASAPRMLVLSRNRGGVERRFTLVCVLSALKCHLPLRNRVLEAWVVMWVRVHHKCRWSTGIPRYLPKKTCRSCTCGSRSNYSHGSKWIWIAMSKFCRYLQVPVGYWLLH